MSENVVPWPISNAPAYAVIKVGGRSQTLKEWSKEAGRPIEEMRERLARWAKQKDRPRLASLEHWLAA